MGLPLAVAWPGNLQVTRRGESAPAGSAADSLLDDQISAKVRTTLEFLAALLSLAGVERSSKQT
jgi:hypothetical protein